MVSCSEGKSKISTVVFKLQSFYISSLNHSDISNLSSPFRVRKSST